MPRILKASRLPLPIQAKLESLNPYVPIEKDCSGIGHRQDCAFKEAHTCLTFWDPKTQLGFWDPLGLLTDATPERYNRLRAVELKHGRISMLAVVGYLTTYAGVRFPGAEDIPAGFAAIQATPVSVWLQVAFTIGVMEAFNRDASDVGGPTPEFAGDFRNGFIDFGWDKQTDEWKLKKRTIELNNGRAAQMGILGLMVHDVLGNVGDILP